MAQLKVFQHHSGDKVFLAVQMLKRHHRLIVRRDEDDYLAVVRPVRDVAGQIQIVIPDPRWPGATEGQHTRINPEDATALDIRIATESEVHALADELLDVLVP